MTNPTFFTGIGDLLKAFEKLHTASLNSLSSEHYRPIQIFSRLCRCPAPDTIPERKQLLINLQALVVKLTPLSVKSLEKDMIISRCHDYLTEGFLAQPLPETSFFQDVSEHMTRNQDIQQVELE